MNGVLEQKDGRWQLRFERNFPHSQEKVWRAITEPAHLKAWFPDEIVGEWRVGAPLRFRSEYGDFDGEVIAYEAPSLVEFRWGTDRLRFEVTPTADGTRLTLIDTIDQLGKASRDAAGWHECLNRLEDHFGEAAASSAREQWRDLHPGYVAAFGPEASTIGPPDKVEK